MPPGRPSKPTRLPVDLLERLTADAEAAGVSIPELVESRCYPPALDLSDVPSAPPRGPHDPPSVLAAAVGAGSPLRCACPSPKPKVASSAPICTACRLPR